MRGREREGGGIRRPSLPLSVSPTVPVVILQGLIIDVAYIVYYKPNSRKRKCNSI